MTLQNHFFEQITSINHFKVYNNIYQKFNIIDCEKETSTFELDNFSITVHYKKRRIS